MELHLVFERAKDGPDLIFVEAETPEGRSVRIGRWIDRPDGLQALVLTVSDEPETDPAPPVTP